MAKILERRLLRKPDVFYFRVDAPLLSRRARPGQFVIVRLHGKGERIPLSLADIKPDEGTISLIVMVVGTTSAEMSMLEVGDEILDLCGPLGNPTHISNVGKVIVVGGGFGIAPLYPIAREQRAAGNEILAIIGARSKDLIIYENEMRDACDRVIITTDDGSMGFKGMVTEALKNELNENGADLVIAIGPAVMMEAVSNVTKPFGVKTMVSLNPIMVDGTGMCGGCRVDVGGKTMFACTDGPEFDGHQVDWKILANRQRKYKDEEKLSFEKWKRRHAHMLAEH